MRKGVVLVAIFMSLLLMGFSFGNKRAEKILYDLPSSTKIVTENFICKAIVGTMISDAEMKDKISAEIFKGTDAVSIQITSGEKLKLLTMASFEMGLVGGQEFSIIRNDEIILSAVFLDKVGGADIFVLNKETGIATWNRSDIQALLGVNPATKSYFLQCGYKNI